MNENDVEIYMKYFNGLCEAIQEPIRKALLEVPEEDFYQMEVIDVYNIMIKIFNKVSEEFFLEQDKIAREYVKEQCLKQRNMKIIK